jgi:hypothetical protein
MTLRAVYAAIIAVLLVAGSQLAVHHAIDAVAKAGTLESRLFQPELRPSDRLLSIALAQAPSGSMR